jgi:OCT family organic cation transporter-like MFS transporter 4/5
MRNRGLLLSVFFSFSRIFHETIPWLLANKRGKEAAQVFCRVAKFNKVDVPPEVIAKLEAETTEKQKRSLTERVKEWSRCRKGSKSEDEVGIDKIFKNAKLRRITVLTCIAWYVNEGLYCQCCNYTALPEQLYLL